MPLEGRLNGRLKRASEKSMMTPTRGDNKFRARFLMAFAVCMAPPWASWAYAATDPVEQRSAVHRLEDETLNRLYAVRPELRQEIQNAVGYAVFSSGSLAVVWVSGGYGYGMVHDNRNGQETHMQMAMVGLGLGVGAKDFNTVFVFQNPKALQDFVTIGLDLSGAADATAKVNSEGGSVSVLEDVLPGVRIYQLTDTGLLAQLMLQVTKYWCDDELNGTSADP